MSSLSDLDAPAPAPAAEDFNLLLRAPSRPALAAFLSAVFRGRGQPAAETSAGRGAAGLGLDAGERARAVAAARALVSACLYESEPAAAAAAGPAAAAAAVAARLPAGVDARLAALLAAEVSAELPGWRAAAVAARAGPPRLRAGAGAAAWQVSVVDGSGELGRFGTAVCELALAVDDTPTSRAALPAERVVRLEMNHASLAALVDSLRRARDALAAVA